MQVCVLIRMLDKIKGMKHDKKCKIKGIKSMREIEWTEKNSPRCEPGFGLRANSFAREGVPHRLRFVVKGASQLNL